MATVVMSFWSLAACSSAGGTTGVSSGTEAGAGSAGAATSGCMEVAVTQANSEPVAAGGASGMTKIVLPGLNGIPSDLALGADGNLWMAQTGLARVQTSSGVGAQGEAQQDNLTLDITRYPGTRALCVAAGPDGNLWFTQYSTAAIFRFDPRGCGEVTKFIVPTPDSQPYGIAAGTDGNLWFTERDAGKIGRITPEGEITEFALPCDVCSLTPGLHQQPTSITAGPDGRMWFIATTTVGHIDTTGSVTQFGNAGVSATSLCRGIATGPDGNVWVGYTRFNPANGKSTAFPANNPEVADLPRNITAGPDSALWLVGRDEHIARVTTAGEVSEPYGAPAQAEAIALGPDRHLWITSPDALWRFAP